MAGTNEAVVELAEEGVVTVDVSDNPELASGTTETPVEGAEETPVVKVVETEAKPEKKVVPRVKLPDQQTASDEASKALSEAVKRADTEKAAREAAEATALAERRKAEAAQSQMAAREQELAAAREAANDRELTILTSSIESTTEQLNTMQEDMERLLEAGEFKKIPALQVKIGRATAALDRLETQKADYESGVRRVVPTEGRVEAPTQQTQDVFEQYVSQYTPPAQAWLRQHRECAPPQVGGKADMNAKMMAGHYEALSKGQALNSPEYFQTINEKVGYQSPTSAAAEVRQAGEEEEVPAVPVRKQAKVQPSAPVSREPPNAQGQVPRTTRSVTLTRDQQDAAKMSFPHLTPQQAFAAYARNMIELEAEGKLGRTTH